MRTKCKTRILLSLLTLVALFIGATAAFAAPAPTSSFTDLGAYSGATINLTAEGTVDWTQCGTTADNLAVARKAPGTSPALTVTPPVGYTASASWYVTSWTDGAAPYATGTNQTQKFQAGTGNSFVWTAAVAPAGAPRILKIWLRNSSGTSTMSAQVGTDAPVAIPIATSNSWYGMVAIAFSSPTPTDVMTVTWTNTGGSGNAFSHGSAALASVSPPTWTANPFSMPSALTGVPYSGHTIAGKATDPNGAVTYSKVSGPAWLTVTPDGTLSGTATGPDVGPNSFQVRAANGAGLTADATMNLTVALASAGNVTTKVVFINTNRNTGWDLAPYRSFLETTVYPGQTMVYHGDTINDDWRYTNNMSASSRQELVDADLIIFDSSCPGWAYNLEAPFFSLKVRTPIMSHARWISSDAGWISGGGDQPLDAGPVNGVSHGYMMMLNNTNNASAVPVYPADPFYAGVYPGHITLGIPNFSGTNVGRWFQVWLTNKNLPTATNRDVGAGGIVLGCPEHSADSRNGGTWDQVGYNPMIERWPQDGLMNGNSGNGVPNGSPASSRRFLFPVATSDNDGSMGSVNDGAMFNPLSGLSADGKTLLKNALLALYTPAYGRRATVNIVAPTVSVIKLVSETFKDVSITDATVTDGGDGIAPTIAWTVTPATGFDAANSTGLATASPTLRFTAPGVYTATLKASKPNLDYVTGTKTITVSAPTVPYIVSAIPTKGRVVANLTAPVTVQFDHLIAFTAPLHLTVTVAGVPTVVNGTTSDNVNFSFDASAIALSGTNTPIDFSLDTSTVKDGFEGLVPFVGNTYTWFAIYNTAGPKPIVICSRQDAGPQAIFVTFLKSVYGQDVPLVTLGGWQGGGYDDPAGWSPATAATINGAALVILDHRWDEWQLNTAQWNALAVPFITANTSLAVQPLVHWAPGDNNWGSENKGFSVENYAGNPYFDGVTVAAGIVQILNSDTGIMKLDYPAEDSVVNGINYGWYRGGDYRRKTMHEWPANTEFYPGCGQQAASRRFFLSYTDNNGAPNLIENNALSANGLKLASNVFKYFAQPSGAPQVIFTDPAATIAKRPTSVTVRFDRSVTAPGALTIQDGTLAPIFTSSAAPVAALDNRVFTYDVPATLLFGLPAQTLTFSLNTMGVSETESGLAIPFHGSAFTWTSAYNPGQLGIKILGLTQGNSPIGNFEAFVKTIWGPGTTIDWLKDDWNSPVPWHDNGEANMANVRAAIAAHDLIVIDRACDSYKFDPGHGWWLNGQYTGVIEGLTKPLISFTPWALDNLAANAGSNDRGGTTQFLAQNTASPIFNGVTIPANRLITAFSSPVTAAAGYFNTVNSILVASTTDADPKNCAISFFPAGTNFASPWYSPMTHPGAIALFQLGGFDNIPKLSPDGRTMLANTLKMLRQVDASPVIVSVSPASGALFTASVPSAIAVTFDRPVAGVTEIKVNNVSILAPVGSVGNTVWTWTITGPALPNLPGTVNVSLTKTGIYETLSGVQLPLGTGTFDWSFTFNKNLYHPTVALVSNTDTSDNHSAYTSFLQNDAFSTSLYRRTIVVEDVPGKYYNMTAGTAATLQATADLVIVLPYQTEASLGGANAVWNALTTPVIIHKPDTCADWGMSNGAPSSGPGTIQANEPASWFLIPANGATAGLTDAITLATEPWLPGVQVHLGTFDPPNSNTIPYFQTNNFQFGCLQGNWWGQPLGGATTLGMFLAPPWSGVWWGAHWDAGAANWAWWAPVAPGKRGYLTMGQNDAGNNFGQDTVAKFFDPTIGAVDLGAKQVLRNALRWAMNPDSKPFPLSVKSVSPPMNGSAGVLGPITVTFSKAVGSTSGVGNPLASDLTWTATLSAVTYLATTVTPSGTPPSDTWVFDGPWENNPALINQFQPINVTLNGMDNASHSHIMSVDGDGCPLTAWTWNYAWNPVPASVPSKLWTLYE